MKRKPAVLKRTGKLKSKPATQETKDERKDQSEADRIFYERIWANRPHFCQVCRTWLGNIMKKAFMDHLLEKSKYPQFRYVMKNIALVCWDCHGCKTVGHPKPKHILLINAAKELLLAKGATKMENGD